MPAIQFQPLVQAACKTRFTCGAKDIDRYFAREAWKQHSRGAHRVTCCHVEQSQAPAGFYTLACVTEEIRKIKGSYHPFGGSDRFPCLQLVWIGVHSKLQGQKIGKLMLGRAIATFAQVGQQIGLPHLVVIPISNDVKPFYTDLGFREYDNGQRMFLPLQSAVEAFK